MSNLDVYDPESALENAVRSILNDTLAAFTPQSDPQFQKERPRVEIQCSLGASKNNHVVDIDGLDEYRPREDGWKIRASLVIVTPTPANGDGGQLHRECRALIRRTMFELPWNGQIPALMPNHVIYAPVGHMGTTPTPKPENGFWLTRMDWDLTISIHKDAWAKLDQP